MQHSKALFGTAAVLTVLATACACITICGLSANPTVIQTLHWTASQLSEQQSAPAIIQSGAVYSNIWGISFVDVEWVNSTSSCATACNQACSFAEWSTCSPNLPIHPSLKRCVDTSSSLTALCLMVLLTTLGKQCCVVATGY